MKHNDELKQALNQKLTDDQIYTIVIDEFFRTTERVFDEMNEVVESRNIYKFNPIYRIDFKTDIYNNKELLKKFTDMIESHGYRYEISAPHNAYCVYINLK